MFKGYIYRHWIINDKGVEKSYIGKTTKQKAEDRWGKGGSQYLTYQSAFNNAIKKYGWDNFHHDIIGVCEAETREQLNKDLSEWEIYYIDKYDSYHNGYNSTMGGDGTVGRICSEETKRKISLANSGKVRSDEFIEYLRESNKGEGNPMYGYEWSEEQRLQLSEAMKEFYQTEQGKALAKAHSEKIKEKYANGYIHPMKGVKRYKDKSEHPMYGKKHSEESKQKQSETMKGRYIGEENPNAKAVICLETKEVFNTLKDGAKWCGLKAQHSISMCCNKKRKTAGKHPITNEPLHWMYYDEYLEMQEAC